MVVLMGLHYASARLTGHDYEHPMTEHIQGRRPQMAWLILFVLLASLYSILSQAALAQRNIPTDIQPRETTPPVFVGRRETRLRDAFRRLPLRFEANIGQTDPEVKFLSR